MQNQNLKTKRIVSVYAFDKEHNMVMYVEKDTPFEIRKIKVVYEDETYDNFNVSPMKLYDDIVVSYNIEGEIIPYHFDKYAMDDMANLENYIVKGISELDFETDIQTAMNASTIRLYTDVYNTEIKTDLNDFAKNLLHTKYQYTINNDFLVDNIKEEIDANVKKQLYTYTYYRKSFDFDIGGINFANLIFFDSERLNQNLTIDYLVNNLSSGNKNMNKTYERYINVITKKTGINLYEQLELFIRMSGTNDYNQWFINNWDGYVKTQEVIGYDASPNLNYKIWDNLTNLYGDNAHLLHLLTIPKEIQPQIGILTTASQLLISDVNIYYSEPTIKNITNFRAKFDVLGSMYGKYYGTSLNYVENGEENLNNDLCVGYDTVLKFQNPSFYGTQRFGSEAPIIKYIYEPSNRIYIDSSVGAVANGTYIYYGYMYGLGSFGIFTHENAHNQDSDYFYNKAGRRNGANAEYHCEGFLTEPDMTDGDFSINRISNFKIEDAVITNLSYERVNSKEELHDYYKDLFDSWYGANTIMGNAFLKSSSNAKYKAAMLVKEERLEEGGNPQVNNSGTYYHYGPSEEILANVDTYEELYDAKVAYKPIDFIDSGYQRGDFWDIIWYTPSNPYGVSDPGTFKTLGYEMLGYKGWTDGLVAWSSLKYPNDEAAIKGITGFDTMKEYKLYRYEEASNKLDEVPYFNNERIEDIAINIYENQKRGNTNNGIGLKKVLLHTIKRVTKDFTDGTFYEKPKTTCYQVGTPEEFINIVNENTGKTGIFIELTNDLDFSNIVTNKDYYAEQFIGIINGNDYEITGLNKPLFNKTRFAIIYDISLDGTSNNLLTKAATYTLIYDSFYDTNKNLFGSGTTTDYVYQYFMNNTQ